MSRPDISMTPAEVEAFLARCPQMVVGAIGADGWPTGTIAASEYSEGVLSIRFPEGDGLLGGSVARRRSAVWPTSTSRTTGSRA